MKKPIWPYLLAPFVSLMMIFLFDIARGLTQNVDPALPPIVDAALCLIVPVLFVTMGIIQVSFLFVLGALQQQAFLKMLVLTCVLGFATSLVLSLRFYIPEIESLSTVYRYMLLFFGVPFIIGIICAWWVSNHLN